MPKVTVIMPSLNVAKYIRSCMESVLGQTMQDLEILAIDAGSTDGTWEILKEYAAMDQRIRLIQSNRKSYGYQVNQGIALAQGEYVGIVETDDRIFPTMYETLYNTAVKTDADYVKGSGIQFITLENGTEWSHPLWLPLRNKDLIGKIIVPQNMPELILNDVFLWKGIYKKEFVSKIFLNETAGAAFQDQGFLFQTIRNAQKAVYLDEAVYQYRQDNTGSSSFNKNGFRYLAEEYTYVKGFLKEEDDTWRSIFYQRMLDQCLGRFFIMAVSGSFWDNAIPDIEDLRGRLDQAVKKQYLKAEDLDSQKWKLLELFLEGAEAVYHYYEREIKEKMAPFYRVLSESEGRDTIIFGAGSQGKFLHALWENRKPEVVCAYCDNNKVLHDTVIQGMPVMIPEEAARKYPDAHYVITGRRYAAEMRRQLRESGITDDRISECVMEMDARLFQVVW